jgi:hypothetical protein
MSPEVIVGGEGNNFSIISSASDWEVNLSFSVNVQSKQWGVEVDVKKNEQHYSKVAVGAGQTVNFNNEAGKAYGRAIYFKASFKKLSQPSPAEPIPP